MIKLFEQGNLEQLEKEVNQFLLDTKTSEHELDIKIQKTHYTDGSYYGDTYIGILYYVSKESVNNISETDRDMILKEKHREDCEIGD